MHPGTRIANRTLLLQGGASPQISRSRSQFFLARVRRSPGAGLRFSRRRSLFFLARVRKKQGDLHRESCTHSLGWRRSYPKLQTCATAASHTPQNADRAVPVSDSSNCKPARMSSALIGECFLAFAVTAVVQIGRFCTADGQKRGLQVQEGRFCTAGGQKRERQVQEGRFCTADGQKRGRQVQEGKFCTAGGLKRELQVQKDQFCTAGGAPSLLIPASTSFGAAGDWEGFGESPPQ